MTAGSHLVPRPVGMGDVEALRREVSSAARGGEVWFLGVVRGEAGKREVTAIEYEAYGEMAGREMARLEAEAGHRYPGAALRILHSTGIVPAGQASVVVVAAAPHRDLAFEACRWGIDRLKEAVPIWKKERFADGGTEWARGG